jgi:hypothetical protein
MDEVIAEVQKLWNRLQELLEKVRQMINRALSFVPPGMGWAVDRIHDSWNDLQAKNNQLSTQLADPFAKPGDPITLKEASDHWIQRAGKLTAAADRTEPNELQTDDINNWGGSSGDRYRQNISAQTEYLRTMSTACTTFKDALEKVVGGIHAFWISIATGLVTFIMAVAGAIGSALTIVGLPAALVLSLIAYVSLLVGVTAAFVFAEDAYCSAEGSMESACSTFSTWPTFSVA